MNSKKETSIIEIKKNYGNSLEENRVTTDQKPFVCPTCPKRYKYKNDLNLHMVTHSLEKPFDCPTCNKQFKRKGDLSKHLHTHTGEKKHVCPTCDKKFNQKGNLNIHIRSVHKNERSYNCVTCEKRFNRKIELLVHSKVHSDVKAYICDTCNKSFKHKNTLVYHFTVHSGEKLFSCSTCKKAFTTKAYLNKHLHNHLKENQKLSKETDLQLNAESTINRETVCHKLAEKEMKQVTQNRHIENVKQEVGDGLEPNESEFCYEVPLIKEERNIEYEQIPSSSYKSVLVKEEVTDVADTSCTNAFDESFVKEEQELSQQ